MDVQVETIAATLFVVGFLAHGQPVETDLRRNDGSAFIEDDARGCAARQVLAWSLGGRHPAIGAAVRQIQYQRAVALEIRVADGRLSVEEETFAAPIGVTG